ncbi:hypothetical protein M0654_03600 [Rhizobium sp. NTR19]|uniref:Uncharacterized protein n=1 Tax=Neorhizobium turbinariae TaxID=2937795 RepID=A0ABT0IML6_9HYPH|nr:hypothetical protein [Neorhizobium turbinariae]MCK8779064.1 hypothetical protein [Neorhizobium turbinariae]
MTFVDIKPGQWVLAFYEPFGPNSLTLAEHLERFTSRGGGWDCIPSNEIFHLYRVSRATPKTYHVDEMDTHLRAYVTKTQYRGNVIAAGTKDEMTELRKRFYAIGKEADDQIDFAVDRLARPVRRRVYAKARKEIHKLLPQHFGRGE